jgi:hypothetical protein
MKTQLTTSAQNLSSSSTRFRTGLILGGIVVAIIVSIFVAQDAVAQPVISSLVPHVTLVTKQAANQNTNLGVIANVLNILF